MAQGVTAGHDRQQANYFAWVAAKFALCMHNAKPNIIKNKTVFLGAIPFKSKSATRYTVLFSFLRNSRKKSNHEAKPNIIKNKIAFAIPIKYK